MKVAVFAAHPDDEILGCGGTIARHVKAGDQVMVVLMGGGIDSRQLDQKDIEDSKNALIHASEQANSLLGVHRLERLDVPDNRADSSDLLSIILKLEPIFQSWKPEIVYTHHPGDLNIDHRMLHESVVTLCRPQPGHFVKKLYFFEVASSTEWQVGAYQRPFVPSHFVCIDDFLDKKIAALSAYTGEMRPWPHARSLDALTHLARWRGASIGVSAAEAFELGRSICL